MSAGGKGCIVAHDARNKRAIENPANSLKEENAFGGPEDFNGFCRLKFWQRTEEC